MYKLLYSKVAKARVLWEAIQEVYIAILKQYGRCGIAPTWDCTHIL